MQASELATSVKDKVVDTGTAAFDTVIDTKNLVVDTKNAVVDTVALATDTVCTITKSVVSFGVTTAVVAGGVGLVVAAVTAPVPVLIGICIVDIMTMAYAFKPNPLDEVEMRAIKRQNGRLIEKLARYGAIPATSLIETPNAKFRLDMNNGTISGTIKSGFFSSSDIQTMSTDDLRSVAASTDKETRSLIEAYLKFRAAQESQQAS
ncbi:hypothetical protein [Rhizobium sp. MHM7A]|uniref:hypothetical protein n=1 Tax=Rhizobium sp. MHM7A TaxID=2583233 RepID=UPI0011074842|nr:hypothetical protein [Rhizobium sp. MHM7A]TLX15937.1 hypothetical protein FFR93_01070 [Rhizobium sp. MHM7A]